jgi:ABC-type nitrate/sulfonate/bicarbonate transport system substrate-binding protein
MNRRSFLRNLSAAGAGLALAPPTWAQTSPPNLGRIAYQMSWIKNFQFVGEYIADTRNYFRKFGLEVDLLAGGPATIVDPIVVSGKALVGESAPDFMANAIAKGAPLKSIGASYQKQNVCIASLAKTPLLTPQDMIGKKIGIQTINLVTWHVFLKLNKIDLFQVDTVPVQFDFAPLISGEVDGFFGTVNDDVVHLESQGYAIHPLLFGDFGYKMLTATYSVRTDSLTDKTKRAQIVAFMKGDILGWQDAIRDPALGAQLTIDVYGKGNGLELTTEKRSCEVTNGLMVTPTTQQHGLFWMSPEDIDATIVTLAAAGVKATPDMFTNEILEEVYQGKSSL